MLACAREAMKATSDRALHTLLKERLEDDALIEEFVTALFILCEDRKKHWRMLRALVHRWSLMQQFNTNQRLQLEAALLDQK